MASFVDLTHTFRDGMPGFRMKDAGGEMTEFTARIRPFLTHAQSRPNYDGKASFEITEVSFQTSLGTYLDAPCHRHPGRGDIASLPLDGLVLDGVVVDARHCTPDRPLTAAELPEAAALAGKAVLIHFGWDRHWGSEAYYAFPHVDRSGLQHLQAAGIALFGVDALNADCTADPERPAHTWFLDAGIHIVENLCGLGPLLGRRFRFFAIPMKVEGAAAFPIPAFAEVD